MAFFRSLSRLSNIGMLSQYVDKVEDLGRRNLLLRVHIKHLYSIWQLCKNRESYSLGVIATNHFYNFGRQLTPEGVNKFFVFALRCGELDESLKLVGGTKDWLPKPPDTDLAHILMSAFVIRKDYMNVINVFELIRNNWQMGSTHITYRLCMESLLCTEQNPLEVALMTCCDSAVNDTSLPFDVHLLLLQYLNWSMENAAMANFYEKIKTIILRRVQLECQQVSPFGDSRMQLTDMR
ncbi:hypothetical protein BBOV_II001335 [Babesia bovis T2Bo]|uniref:hypothetical protein n=1 Tax=Babesia bovis T2Bo TaxID=484906 RepID=UPI001C344EED|nr:hypothetical protein BBOV_II001335 [Babesia bovis T2Bo]KAG6440114.1 hypothetical protein BBOV_II001335 [Babesia bovis T2Bo]